MTLHGVKAGTEESQLDDPTQLASLIDPAVTYNTVTGDWYNKTYDNSGAKDHSDYLSYRLYWNGKKSDGGALADGTYVIADVTAELTPGVENDQHFYFPIVIATTAADVTSIDWADSGRDGTVTGRWSWAWRPCAAATWDMWI